MSSQPHPDRFTTRQHRSFYLAGYLLIFAVALRRFARLDGAFVISLYASLLGTFVILYATHSSLSRRFPHYSRVYFPLQMIIVQILGIFEEYLDNWAFLYIVLGIQAAYSCSRRSALVWGGLFATSTLVTLSFEFGLLSGLGRGMVFLILGIFFISFDIQYAQSEDAKAESQVLLDELQAAHQRLKDQADQAEQLAAAEERNRIAQEIHDSVGQKIFAIQLMAETSCVLLEKNPESAAKQLELLQEQTEAALSQMRELISRWRPDPDGRTQTAPPSNVRDLATGIPLPSDV